MRANWKRTSSDKPCPICGKHDWCMLSADGSAVICPRVEDGAHKYLDGSGYLHIIDKTIAIPDRRDEKGEDLPEHSLVMSTISTKMMNACDDSRLDGLARMLGVTRTALRLLRVGWSAMSDAFSFPMFRSGQRVIGIRLRNSSGQKWAIRGSRAGLFIPTDWPSIKPGVLICEGPTDTAALLSLGFNAVGRPSAMGSHALIEEAVAGRPVCLVADTDSVGMDSANKLAEHLRRSGSCPKVSILVPPAKDVRDWVNSGISREEIATHLKAASMHQGGVYLCR